MVGPANPANSPAANLAQRDLLATAVKRATDGPRRFSIPYTSNMSESDEDLPPIPYPIISTIALEQKPSARIHYTYYPASSTLGNVTNPFSQTLIVFLNGAMLSRNSWDETIRSFLEKRVASRLPYPAILSYDRYGQGESDHDPADHCPPPCHGHDLMSAVHALKQLTLQIWRDHMDAKHKTHYPCLIFVCNSIGCALARLFAQTFPGTVSGLLFLDSIMANSDGLSIWPDPDAPDFDPNTLPEGVSADDVRDTRQKWRNMFHPDVPSREGLSRRNLAKLLPYDDAPSLEGYLGRGPYLTVVGHDWETFAQQSYTSILHTPKSLTMTYASPAWRTYNEGLTRITEEGRAIGPIVAVGCGHFIQRDGPDFVSDELVSLLDRVVNRVEQVSERVGLGG